MADVVKFKIPDAQRPDFSGYPNLVAFVWKRTVAAGDCPQNDNIVCFDLPANYQIVTGILRQSDTLGASATAQLRAGTTAITAATTAGGADSELLSAVAPFSTSEQAVNILIAGAALDATVDLTVVLFAVDVSMAR